MVPLALFGYLMCNVLLAWATLHKPYISNPRPTLSLSLPQNKNEWVHLVIFKPQLKVQLTQSSYKVTSFLDFQPFLKGFQSVNKYLRDLTEDINNPNYFQRIVFPYRTFQVTSLSNESTILKFFNTHACQANPYGCKSELKLEQYRLEIQHVIKVFRAVYKKFLTAIDHTDYHPLQMLNTTRVKRSEEYDLYGQYHSPTQILTASEENFLDKCLKAMYKINPSLHKNLSCMKRVGILTWILGWGVYSNAQSISKIKDNLHTLQRQNQLQDKQIKHLAKYLHLTVHQVSRHSEMLYEMDTKMFIMNKTIQDIMWSLDFLQYESDVLHYFQSRISRVHLSLYALRGDVNSLYEYMRALASQELNPMIIPPDILKRILHKIIEDINLMLDSSYVRTLRLTYGLTMELLD